MTLTMLLFVLTLFAPAAPPVPDVSGSWAVMGELAGNGGGFFTATCAFEQKADKLGGVCKRTSGDTNVSGEVTEQDVKFQYDIVRQDVPMTFQFTGTVGKAGAEISGQVILIRPDAPALDGTFTATKEKK
jgi:hypothetical protein